MTPGQDAEPSPTASPVAPAPAAEPPRRAGSNVAPAAVWAFAFLVFRIFAVSNYDWDTAFLVSTTLGIDDGLALVFGSFMATHLVVAVSLVFVLPLFIGTYLWSPNGRRPVVVLPTALGLVTLVALTMSFGLWWLPLSSGAVLGVFALTRRMPPDGHVRRIAAMVMARVGWVVAAAGLLVALLVQTPWVPEERIETTEGVIIGYVLSVDSGYLNVLTEDHEFVVILSVDVRSRE